MAAVTPEAPPRDVGLRMQLAAITGSEPPESFIEIRPLGRDGRPAVRERAFVPVREHQQVMERVVALAPRLNVFVGVAPRSRAEGHVGAVGRVWTLWADLDGCDGLKRLAAFRPLPAIVIRSGSADSAHGYWPMKRPLEPSWAQRANRRLALALAGDMCATDPARILRATGTLNHKQSPPPEVICTRCELEAFTVDEVVGGLPDSTHYAPRRVTPRGAPSGAGSVAGVLAFVRSAAIGERNRCLNWAAYRLGERADLDHEAVREELRQAALDTGLSEIWAEQLDQAVLIAAKRPLGDGGFAWSRKGSTASIAPLVAVTLALWGCQALDQGYTGPLMELI